MTRSRMVVLGGGVIGLSIAYELVCRGHWVQLIDARKVERQSSWAGAGILPPVNSQTAIHPLEFMEGLSTELHRLWHKKLLTDTGIDNGLIACGGIYLARTIGEQAALAGQVAYWKEREIDWQFWGEKELKSLSGLRIDKIRTAYFLPGEYQVRNPRHLQALEIACRQQGVELSLGVDPARVKLKLGSGAAIVNFDNQPIHADQVCVAAGAWSEQLLAPLGIKMPVTPVRGQMVLFKLPERPLAPIINEGTRYLVPRSDGFVLAGATIEEVGFQSNTEPDDIAELVEWAHHLLPACNQARCIDQWAGLRPASADALPYIGSLGQVSNLLVATGHFKAGLHLSTATAVVIADLIENRPLSIDLTPFDPQRTIIHSK